MCSGCGVCSGCGLCTSIHDVHEMHRGCKGSLRYGKITLYVVCVVVCVCVVLCNTSNCGLLSPLPPPLQKGEDAFSSLGAGNRIATLLVYVRFI